MSWDFDRGGGLEKGGCQCHLFGYSLREGGNFPLWL